MVVLPSTLSVAQRRFLDRLMAVAERDPRLAAVALAGSHVTGKADAHSDVDLVLVAEDESFESLVHERAAFLRSVEELLWSQSWGRVECWFFISASGVDGDLTVLRVSEVAGGFSGPFLPLVDKRGLLDDVRVSGGDPVAGSSPPEIATRLEDFWHDFQHLVTALGRGQLWWAEGQLEALRGMCTNLLRLAANPADPEVGDETYWKVELSMPAAQLRRLEPTLNTRDRASMLLAAKSLAALYGELGRELASAHGVPFPEALERLMLARLAELAAGD